MKTILITFFSLGALFGQSDFSSFEEALVNPLNIVSLKIEIRQGDEGGLDSRVAQLENLEKLSIVSYIDEEVLFPKELGGLKKLRKLNLEIWRYDKIPPNIFHLTRLKELKISCDYCSEIPDHFSVFDSLTQLLISSYKTQHFPLSIYKLHQLESLSFGASISVLPKGISALKKLEELSFSSSSLKKLPIDLGYLKRLKRFTIQCNNQIKVPLSPSRQVKLEYFRWVNCPKFPVKITRFKNIKSMYFDGGTLTKVPNSIGRLKNITELNLSFQPINSLPKSVSSLPKLGRILLRGSAIRHVSVDIFEMDSLFFIDLEDCEDMDKEFLKEMKNSFGEKIWLGAMEL